MSTITMRDGTQLYYKDWESHSFGDTRKNQVNSDVLAFIGAELPTVVS